MAVKEEAKGGTSAWTWAMALICALLPLLGFWAYGLFDLDEGYYAAVSEAMARTGDWLIPKFDGAPWFEKPILFYWLAAPAIAAFGEAIGPRLPSALCHLALCALCGWFGHRRLGASAGPAAAAILGTSLLPVAMGRMAMTDAALNLSLAAALLAYFESLVGRGMWRVVSGASLGLAMLAKGPVSLALFGGVAVWTWFAEPSLRPKMGGMVHWSLGSLAFLLVVGAWYAPAAVVSGGSFVEEFILKNNVERFLGGDRAHAVPWWAHPIYFPVVLLLGAMPWTPWVFGALRNAFLEGAAERYLARWVLTVLVFFTLSSGKLPHYVLPAMVPLALLIAGRVSRGWLPQGSRRFWSFAFASSMLLFVGLYAGFRGYYVASGQAEAHAHAQWLRRQVGNVAFFRIGALAGSPTPSGMRPSETILPSLSFLLRGRGANLELPSIASHKAVSWILTRRGRIGDAERRWLAMAGIFLSPAQTPSKQDRFQVYRLERRDREDGSPGDSPSRP